MAGTEYEAVDLTDVPTNDLDYYAYELGRLQDVAREMVKTFGSPTEVVTALAAFNEAVPRLRAIRNPLTHADDTARLDTVGRMQALIRYEPNGAVVYLVDPRYEQHDAAESLAATQLVFLRSGL